MSKFRCDECKKWRLIYNRKRFEEIVDLIKNKKKVLCKECKRKLRNESLFEKLDEKVKLEVNEKVRV